MEKKEILNEYDEFMFNESSIEPDDFDIEDDEFETDDCNWDEDDYDWRDEPKYRRRHYGEFQGSYAQDVCGYSDEDIWDAFDGFADAYWNID